MNITFKGIKDVGVSTGLAVDESAKVETSTHRISFRVTDAGRPHYTKFSRLGVSMNSLRRFITII